ncbi:MAG: hypothetical protein KDD63_18445, partial [Bacteroidetes bacterium]|nr:hypothetical protein [Bacteroidota bacterium]
MYVTARENGKPVSGAKVQLYKRDNSSGEYTIYGEPLTSTKEGLVSIETRDEDYNTFQLKISYKDDLFTSDRLYLYSIRERDILPVTKVHFFTDRKIYRPGQTIYFKAILLKQMGDEHEIRPDYPVEITFFDVNNQEVEKRSLTSNEYGTVSGSFVAPTSGLLGRMYLRTAGGYHDFSVEEYKRPRFEVSFEPVKGEFALNDEIEVGGQAIAFSGANITGATVNYRVVREVQYPYWFGYFWRFPMPRAESREIVNGTTTTDETGKFSVPFTLIPDASTKKSQKPVFTYRVYADVVDITGETHSSSTSVRAGYIGLDVGINVPEEVDQRNMKPFSIQTKNLNGNFEPAKGEITVSRLQEPDQVFRKRRWSQADQRLISATEYRQKFPHDVYEDEDQYENWPVDEEYVFSQSFNTGDSKELLVTGLSDAKPGKYKLELTTADKAGEEIKISNYFSLVDPKAKRATLPVVLDLSMDKIEAEPGETVTAILATTEKKVWVRFEVEKKGEILVSRLINLKKSKKTRIPIAIKEAHRGNISISAVTIDHNQFYEKTQTVIVPWTNKELSLSWSTFRDKLLPGQKETWKLKISGHKSEEVAAEMVATLYDASLDQFSSNDFYLSLYEQHYRQINWEG